MSICITQAGETLIASLQAQGLPLVIDTMIFANVPDLDPAQPADRAQVVPAAHVVHSAAIPAEFRSFVNPNQVVYSVLLGSDVGDFTFNWQGLYCSAHQTLIAVAELPAIEKRANDEGTNTPGNNLTRNFMLQFTGAQALTGLTVEAEVWQLDFTVRLKGIDERERLSNRDIYGRAAFRDAGWLLEEDAGSYHFEPGTGYVEGIRAALASQLPAVPAPLPCDVYLDVCLAPQGSDVVTLVTPRFVAQGAGLPDYTEGAPFHTPHYCVQIARVAADGAVTDLRPKAVPLVDGSLGSHNNNPAAHPNLAIPYASETVAGKVLLSTTAQARAGTDDTTAMSPTDVATAIADVVRGYTRQQYPAPVVLAGIRDVVSINLDLHQELWGTVTGPITIANPTNYLSGKWCTLRFYSTSAQTISWGSSWRGTSLVELPTATVAYRMLHMSFLCLWSGTQSMQLMGMVQGA